MSQELNFDEIDKVLSTCDNEDNLSKRMRKLQPKETVKSYHNKTAPGSELGNASEIELNRGLLLAKMPDQLFKCGPWTTMLNDYREYDVRKNIAHHKRIYANQPSFARKKVKLLLVLVKQAEVERGHLLASTVKDDSGEICAQINCVGMLNQVRLIEPGVGLVFENVLICGNPNFPYVVASEANLLRIYPPTPNVDVPYLKIEKKSKNAELTEEKLLPFVDLNSEAKKQSVLDERKRQRPSPPHANTCPFVQQSPVQNLDDSFFSSLF